MSVPALLLSSTDGKSHITGIDWLTIAFYLGISCWAWLGRTPHSCELELEREVAGSEVVLMRILGAIF